MLYIAKILENEGDKVSILDFSAESFEEQKIINTIKNVDVIGITVLTFAIENVIEIVKIIKKNKPKIRVILGGPHCTLLPIKVLEETQADISVQGDGELVILEIKKAIKGEIPFSDVHGIYYKDKNKIKKGANLQFIENLDSLPFPARNIVKNYYYGKQYNPKMKMGDFTSIITTRGCPYRCKFCSRESLSMKTYRIRSIKNIIKELKEIKEDGYKFVAIVDDSFLSNKKQAEELLDEIIKDKLNLKIIITATRVDVAEKELYQKMKKAGVTHIQYGLESGNQDVLDFYNKNITLEKIRYAVNLSNEMGFFNMGSFILGAPFETREHFERTINFAKSLPLDSVGFMTLKYMIGSELWNNLVKDGKISKDDYIILADSKKGLGIFTEDEILKYCIKARRDYYLRPSFMIRLFIKSLKNNDFGFFQSYISLFFSDIKDGLSYIGIIHK